MPFTKITLDLKPCQLRKIREMLGDTEGRRFCVFAEPQVEGSREGLMDVMVCTREQYEVLKPAMIAARDLPAFEEGP